MEKENLPLCSEKEIQAIDKIMKCIDSALTTDQLSTCVNMIQNYMKIYERKRFIMVFTTMLRGYIMRKMTELNCPMHFSDCDLLTQPINLKEVIKNFNLD